MKSILTISPARIEDGPELETLEALAFGVGSWGDGGVSNTLTMIGVHGVKALLDGVFVGFGLWRTADTEGDILTIAVLPAHRRQGVASALLKAMIADANAKGVNALFLEVAADNDAALALYRAAQFMTVGERPGYYKSGQTAVLMKRTPLDGA